MLGSDGPLIVHVGQCGIQLGSAMWRQLAGLDDMLYNNEVPATPRAILIDTEPKPMTAMRRDARVKQGLLFGDQLCITDRTARGRGRGGSWAMGYADNSQEFLEQIENTLRREIECDPIWELDRHASHRYSDHSVDVIIVHSLAGGTGSGLGSRVMEMTRGQLGRQGLLAAVSVVADPVGGSPMRSINEILALQRIEQTCDLGILVENGCFQSSSMKALNTEIAAALIDVMQTKSGLSLDDFQCVVCPMPTLKFAHIYAANALEDLRMHIPPTRSQNSLIAARAVVGSAVEASITEKVTSCLGGRVPWNGPYNVDLRRRLPSSTLGDNSRRVSLAVNWTYTASMVSELQRDATEKIRHGAFMHHYNMYGVDEETLLEAAQDVQDTIVTPYE
ncbi:hypothetical protein FOZ63_002834, partial [Perkinsus olseni]